MDDTNENQEPTTDLEEFFEVVHQRFEQAKTYWDPIFDEFRNDVKFLAGDMWNDKVKAARKGQGLSTLTIDKISSKIKYIVNNARAAMPGVKVHPVKDGATANTAKIFDGLIKAIGRQSNVKQARIGALKAAVTGGLGAYRVNVVMDADQKELAYERVTDPTTIYIDPTAKSQVYEDAQWAFVVAWLPEADFNGKYPDCDPNNFAPQYKSWRIKDMVQVVEYWVKGEDKLFDHYLITADKVLSDTLDYAGKYLPIFFLTGEETAVDDVRDFRGVVRGVKDMQMLHNLSKSVSADWIARAATAQWLAEADQVKDYQQMWSRANINGSPVLLYKGTASGGKPQRLDPVPPPTGSMETSKETDEDIRMTIGIRDPLADIPASQSGKAIQLQIAQGNVGTFEFTDKLNDLVMYEGKVVTDLVPYVYSYPHIREIIGIDEQVAPVPLNQPYIENGEEVMHDLTRGKYTVSISTGPSYQDQRSETSDKLIELVGKYPDMMQVAGDLIVRNMDFEGKDELADRLRAMIPPNVLASSSSSNANGPELAQQQMAILNQQLQEAQAQIQQAQQEAQAAQAELAQAKEALTTKANEIRLNQESAIATEQTKTHLTSMLEQERHAFELQVLQLKQAHEERMLQLKLSADASKVSVQGEQKIEQITTKGQIDGALSSLEHEQTLAQLQEETVLNVDTYATTGEDLLQDV